MSKLEGHGHRECDISSHVQEPTSCFRQTTNTSEEASTSEKDVVLRECTINELGFNVAQTSTRCKAG